jgi:predicted ATP-dependent Lon-type protease
MLTDGFYAEVSLEYDAVIAQERNGRPFRIAGLRPIQMSNPNVSDPRGHEFPIQLRAMDNDRSGAGLGLPVMVALGGSVEIIPNAIAMAGLAVEKQAKVLLMPVSARRGLNDLPCSGSTRTKDHILSTIKKSDGVTLDLDHIVKRNSCSLIGQGR